MALLWSPSNEAHAGDVKSNLVLQIADNDVVTIVNQGTSAFPGNVGSGTPSNLLYQGGWGCTGTDFILWKDTNSDNVLRMDCSGLDVLISNGVANDNGSKTGNVTLTASTQVGSRLKFKKNPGCIPFTDIIFVNGSTAFTVSGQATLGAPDLITLSPVVLEGAALNPGQSFTVLATVRNLGAGTCETPTLRFFLSTDAGIQPTLDEEVATTQVPALASGASSSETALVTGTKLPEPGRYWIGGCVDRVAGEPLRGSNCSTGFEILVGPPCDVVSVANRNIPTMQTIQACRTVSVGPTVTVSTDLGAHLVGGDSVELLNEVTVEADAQLTIATCGHDICTTSSLPLTPTCMPCVEMICESSPSCCSSQWSASCVSKVAGICNLGCPLGSL